MDEKRKEKEVRELTPEEIDDMILEEQIASGEHNEKVPEYYFSNPDPYARSNLAPIQIIAGDTRKTTVFCVAGYLMKAGHFRFKNVSTGDLNRGRRASPSP